MNDASTALLLVRVGLSLGLVVGLILLASRVLRRRGGGIATRRSGPSIELLERRNVGKRSSVALIRVDDRRVLVGVTDQQIGLLADLGVDARDDEPSIDVRSAPSVDVRSVEVSEADERMIGTGGSPDGTGMLVADLTDSRFPLGTTPTRPPKLSLVQAVRELTVRRH